MGVRERMEQRWGGEDAAMDSALVPDPKGLPPLLSQQLLLPRLLGPQVSDLVPPAALDCGYHMIFSSRQRAFIHC